MLILELPADCPSALEQGHGEFYSWHQSENRALAARGLALSPTPLPHPTLPKPNQSPKQRRGDDHNTFFPRKIDYGSNEGSPTLPVGWSWSDRSSTLSCSRVCRGEPDDGGQTCQLTGSAAALVPTKVPFYLQQKARSSNWPYSNTHPLANHPTTHNYFR